MGSDLAPWLFQWEDMAFSCFHVDFARWKFSGESSPASRDWGLFWSLGRRPDADRRSLAVCQVWYRYLKIRLCDFFWIWMSCIQMLGDTMDSWDSGNQPPNIKWNYTFNGPLRRQGILQEWLRSVNWSAQGSKQETSHLLLKNACMSCEDVCTKCKTFIL